MSSDPWTSFLDWLTTVLVPAWGELIGLLPYLAFATIAGPILTIVAVMWVWYLVKRRRGRIKRAEAQPVAAVLDAEGRPVFPANVPYCKDHALIFPPRARQCTMNGYSLSVACPVDGTIRNAEVDTCAACGTKYKLGATSGAVTVLSSDGPPEGGAAIA
jgi:hypothetical protein